MRTRWFAVPAIVIGTLLLAGCAQTHSGSPVTAQPAIGSGRAPTAGTGDSRPTTRMTATSSARTTHQSRPSSSSTAPRAPASTAWTASTASASAQDVILAKLVAGVPAADMGWRIPKAIPGWAVLSEEPGLLSYRVGSRCTVLLAQPLLPTGVLTSMAFVKDGVRQVGELLKVDRTAARTLDSTGTMLAATVAGLPRTVSIRFAGIRMHFPDAKVAAQVYGYASGKIGVIVTALCHDDDVDTYQRAIRPQLNRLVVVMQF